MHFFHAYIRAALNVDDIEFATVQDAMRAELRDFIRYARADHARARASGDGDR
jgi:hypothetical protein